MCFGCASVISTGGAKMSVMHLLAGDKATVQTASKMYLAAPFIVSIAISLMSWPLGKLVSIRVASVARTRKWDEDDAKATVKWAIDGTQAFSCIFIPAIGLYELSAPKGPTGLMYVVYVGSAFASFLFALLVFTRKDIIVHSMRLPFGLMPAAVAGVGVNVLCCMLAMFAIKR